MKFEYDFFLLHAAPYLADERRVAMKKWLNELGEQGWEVVHLGPMKESEAGVVAWAKRPVHDPLADAAPELLELVGRLIGRGEAPGQPLARHQLSMQRAFNDAESVLRRLGR